jgi:hypothetical protein
MARTVPVAESTGMREGAGKVRRKGIPNGAFTYHFFKLFLNNSHQSYQAYLSLLVTNTSIIIRRLSE